MCRHELSEEYERPVALNQRDDSETLSYLDIDGSSIGSSTDIESPLEPPRTLQQLEDEFFAGLPERLKEYVVYNCRVRPGAHPLAIYAKVYTSILTLQAVWRSYSVRKQMPLMKALLQMRHLDSCVET